jgi:hypothetical protein
MSLSPFSGGPHRGLTRRAMERGLGFKSAARNPLWFGDRRAGFDPKATFKVGPVNEREARESGLWLKAWFADCRHAGTVFAPDPQERALIVSLGLFLATGGSGPAST